MKTLTTLKAITGMISVCLPVVAATTCESLHALKMPETVITLAQSVPAGAFTPLDPAAPGRKCSPRAV